MVYVRNLYVDLLDIECGLEFRQKSKSCGERLRWWISFRNPVVDCLISWNWFGIGLDQNGAQPKKTRMIMDD